MNKLKRLRRKAGLTQMEAADYLNISRRSYQMYESGEDNKSEKFLYLCEKMGKLSLVDEEHGILDVDDIKMKVNEILDSYEVRSCYLFGSYATGNASENSDVNLLIDTDLSGIAFYGLAEELNDTLKKKVDLLSLSQVIGNELQLSVILQEGIRIR